MERKLYMLWTGKNQMSKARSESVQTTKSKCGVEFHLLFDEEIRKMQKKDFPFHPAYDYLSLTHKADYVRCYIMHHYGGGYADIKQVDFDWNPYFIEIENDKKLYAVGYAEVDPSHIAINPENLKEKEIRQNYHDLIGNCNYIFRKGTPLTREWISRTHKKLDEKFSLLKQNPASFPQDMLGAYTPQGERSKYPLRWAEILGEIFHPLVFEYRQFVSKKMPKYTKKQNYR